MTLILSGTDGLSDVDGTAATPAIRGTDTNTGIFFPAADTIAFSEGGTEAMRIDSSGNVGVGTSSPGYKVDVSASSFITASFSTSYSGAGNIRIADASTTSASAPYIGSVGNNLTFGRIGTAEYARIDSSGNLGIGTSSPSGNGRLELNVPSGSNTNLTFYENGSSRWLIGSLTGSNAFRFYDLANASERARIDSSGRLLVGTTSAPTQTGGVIVADDELFVYNIPTTASSANCHISSGESNRFYRSTSALKYKQDIRDIELIDINKFRPVRYKSKCDNDDQTKDHFGVVADEVHAAGITELVSYGADGEIEGFQYERLTVVLLKAIQEQQALIQSLTARIEALEGK